MPKRVYVCPMLDPELRPVVDDLGLPVLDLDGNQIVVPVPRRPLLYDLMEEGGLEALSGDEDSGGKLYVGVLDAPDATHARVSVHADVAGDADTAESKNKMRDVCRKFNEPGPQPDRAVDVLDRIEGRNAARKGRTKRDPAVMLAGLHRAKGGYV